jgi:hypothetical protein
LSASTYDPLAASTYMEDEADPWSGAPTPSRTPALPGTNGAGNGIAGGLAAMGGGALGRLMNGMNIGGASTAGTSVLIGMSTLHAFLLSMPLAENAHASAYSR